MNKLDFAPGKLYNPLKQQIKQAVLLKKIDKPVSCLGQSVPNISMIQP